MSKKNKYKKEKMSDIKIHCNKCNAKFFTLNREKIICTKCSNTIIVKEELNKMESKEKIPNDAPFSEEHVDDILLTDDELEFSPDSE